MNSVEIYWIAIVESVIIVIQKQFAVLAVVVILMDGNIMLVGLWRTTLIMIRLIFNKKKREF